jgi:hypothetical protein
VVLVPILVCISVFSLVDNYLPGRYVGINDYNVFSCRRLRKREKTLMMKYSASLVQIVSDSSFLFFFFFFLERCATVMCNVIREVEFDSSEMIWYLR